MLLLHPRPLLLIAISLFITLALCNPVPQGTVWVTEVTTVRASDGTPTDNPTGTAAIKGEETSFAGIGVRFRTEPSGRGTIGIIISCTATYIFCVWTTVAPAVGETGKKHLRLWYKLVLTLIAIAAPAGIMIYAFDEYRQAQKLQAEWKKYTGPKSKSADKVTASKSQQHDFNSQDVGHTEPDPNAEKCFKLHIGTAFFVLMGGFRVDVDNWEEEEGERRKEPRKPKPLGGEEVYHRPILTPHGFVEYIKTGRITSETFNQRDVLDKGKGSHIAKIFAAIQAVWLILQSLARWAAGLPLTILEIHVLIQIFCTSVIFVCWFRKPLDIGVPTTIRLNDPSGPHYKEKAGAESETEAQGQGQGQGGAGAQSPSQKYHRELIPTPEPPSSPGSTISRAHTYSGEMLHCHSTSPFMMRSDTRTSRRTGNSTLFETASEADSNAPGRPEKNTDQSAEQGTTAPDLDRVANRNSLYKEAAEMPLKTAAQIATEWVAVTAKAFLDVATHTRPVHSYNKGTDVQQLGAPDFTTSSIPEKPKTSRGEEYSKTRAWMVTVHGFLVVVVASLHLSAWHSQFPTGTEQWLWRVSCFAMVGFPAWIVAVVRFSGYDGDMFDILWRTHLQKKEARGNFIKFAWLEIHQTIRKRSLSVDDQKKYTESRAEIRAESRAESRAENPSLLLSQLKPRKAKMALHYIMLWSCIISIVLYFVASSYITLESFVSVRWLRDEHFQSPKWSNFIPHL
ncbi:hypothetical protein DFP73DRAFT_405531 [Morchella snyderi]|nr:hypothetical protein DFP73DRAFT_405531 [Morchella snyderi]